jgi:hypothetical protein
VAQWNANAQKIDSVICRRVEIDGKSEDQIYSLNAQMAYQRTNRFRLSATSPMGKSEVDLGSNEDEIWFWIARATPPAVYFCKREQLPNVRLGTPFQPDWLMEAMGVMPVDLKLYRPGDADTAEYFTLVAEQRSPTGEPVIKRIVFNRRSQRIDAFELFNLKGGLLARAEVLEYHDNPEAGVFLPRVVQVEWPQTDTKLKLRLQSRSLRFNNINAELAGQLFRRDPDGYIGTEEVDLAQVELDARQGTAAPASTSGPQMRQSRLDRNVEPARAAQLTGQILPSAAETPNRQTR